MSTGKRLRSTPDVADSRPNKMIYQTPLDTTSESDSKPFTLELLPENELPPRQELTRLNGLIHDDMKRTVVNQTLRAYDVYPTLLTVGKHYKSLDMDQMAGWPSLREDEQAVSQILEMAQDAYRVGDYRRLMLIKGLRLSESPKPVSVTSSASTSSSSSRSTSTSSASSQVPQAVVEGWNSPYIGTAHIVLEMNIKDMFKAAMIGNLGYRKYMTHATIIQNSGSGKSRLVDKVAETIFTIPFNVREAQEAAGGAWPPADDEIRDVLVQWAWEGGEMRMQARYFCFFTAVFEEVRKEVERCLAQPASAHTAFDWRAHLGQNESERRDALYARVVNSDVVRDANAMPSDVESATVRKLRKTARSALKRLLAAVCPRTTCDISHTDKTGSSIINDVHVLIYFDEAHVLANELSQSGSPLGEPGTTALDVLFPLLDDFRDRGLFAVFISTQSHLEHLDSMPSSAPLSSSARKIHLLPYAHAPITETPFDCFGDRPVIPSRLRAEDLCDVAFMACFGRPMWRSLLLPFCDKVLANASGTPQNYSLTPLDAYQRGRRCEGLLHLALVKLVFHADLDREWEEFSKAAQTAVLDVRIMLPFEPRSSAAYRLQMELVASHLRTVYSVPQHREHVRSGYPPEPILAEAAAHQLHIWRTNGAKRTWRHPVEPGLLTLKMGVDDGLLDRGEIGEAVGRLLLTLARDRASLATFPKTLPRLFSRAVPVNAFIKALFAPAVAQQVLDSKPNNLPEGAVPVVTFAEAFKDAVLNFTHFARWQDGSAPPCDHAAVRCFVRSMAVVCRKNSTRVDAFIPILLDKSAHLRPQVMTGLLVRFTREHQGKTSAYAYAFDEKDAEQRTPPAILAGGQTAPPRPYITLAMELGSPDPPESPHTEAATSVAPVDDVNSSNSEVPRPTIPRPVVVDQPPALANFDEDGRTLAAQHPRYSITAYGCSRSVYQVVGEEESGAYERILGQGDPLQEHPRQDARSLDVVRRMKPEFSDATGWGWVANDGSSMDVQPEFLSAEALNSEED